MPSPGWRLALWVCVILSGLASPALSQDDLAARHRSYGALKTLDYPGLRLRVPEALVADAEVRAVTERLARAVTEMAGRVPLALEEPLELVFEEDYVAMGRHLGRVGTAPVAEVVAGAERVHAVFDPREEAAYRHGLARALVRRASLAGARSPWLEEGAALWLSRRWYGRDFAEWLPDLVFARVLPRTPELLAAEKQRDGSDVLWPPAAAAVVNGLAGETLAAKLTREPGAITVESSLRALEERHGGRDDASRREEPPERPSRDLPFLRGVSLAMPPGLEYAYHSPTVVPKLEILQRLGADAVSLMPYAFLRGVDQPELHSRITSPTDETDAGLVHAARKARERGFRVLWKPHVYVWGDGWVGEVAMTSEEDWRRWWRSYRRYIVHHAVLAAHVGSEMMAVGVELGGTLEREADWRHLVRSVRRVYPGHLTYAGNWWGDYDRVPFWDALDFIGVDAYFPLGDTEVDGADDSPGEAGDGALAAGVRRMMEQVAQVARREGKGVLFTEVGFAARRHAWTKPHEEGGEFSAEDQHRAYRVLLSTLGQPDWLDGVFLWKVFSTPGVAGDDDTRPDFRFLGRPAQEAVAEYFTHSRERAR